MPDEQDKWGFIEVWSKELGIPEDVLRERCKGLPTTLARTVGGQVESAYREEDVRRVCADLLKLNQYIGRVDDVELVRRFIESIPRRNVEEAKNLLDQMTAKDQGLATRIGNRLAARLDAIMKEIKGPGGES
jgi:diphthamide synthase (EF-2-diphthine--ammonia ligase)